MSIAISAQDVKSLRERTGAGIMDAKAALQDSGGDIDKAIEILRVKGQASAAKRGERAAAEGVVSSYIHAGGQIGVLVEVDCETDFVARTERVPGLRTRGCPARRGGQSALRDRGRGRRAGQGGRAARAARAGGQPRASPQNVQEKIVEGRLKKWLEDVVLLDQTHVNEEKHGGKTVGELRTEIAANTGENVVIRRFARFQVGGE